jgi:hypothetical protein
MTARRRLNQTFFTLMTALALLTAVIVIALLLRSPNAAREAAVAPPPARAAVLRAPLHFEPNRGQVDPVVLFLSRGPGYDLRLDGEGASVTSNRADSSRTVRPAPRGGDARGVDQPGHRAAGKDPLPPRPGRTPLGS